MLAIFFKAMEYNQLQSEEELKQLRVFSDDELNCEDAHLGFTLVNELEYVGRKLTTNSSVPSNIHRDKYPGLLRGMILNIE